MPTPTPIDPATGGPVALEGRIVTMDPAGTVLDRGTLYVDQGRIIAVNPAGAPAPSGFENVVPLQTGGTLYPGLIELHNHLSYNVLRLWDVPKPYKNRDQWGGGPLYRKIISGPMNVLGHSVNYVTAVVRFVEARCLLGGVTTSQGIALFSNQGITRYYRGIVRNVEQTDDPELPEADARIADVDAADAARFKRALEKASCLLLHLSEGTNPKARDHFRALQMPDGTWAITSALAGIHCVALNEGDLAALAANGGAMVWSPLSNLLLYGQTANIKAARAAGVRMGLGSDWSPSGSKNLLGELKVARLESAAQGGVFSDRELVAMATRDAAAILKWDRSLGSLEAGKYADVLVVDGRGGDPYGHLLEASETEIGLVVINGVPRYGRKKFMEALTPGGEGWRVGGSPRKLNLAQETADPIVGALSLTEARDRLKDGLANIRDLAAKLEEGIPFDVAAPPQWFLVLDQEERAGAAARPHLSFGGAPTGMIAPASLTAAAKPLSELLEPLELDAPTVVDDGTFLERLAAERNLPGYIKEGLPALY